MSDTLLDKNKIWQQIDDEKENMLQLWQATKQALTSSPKKSKPF